MSTAGDAAVCMYVELTCSLLIRVLSEGMLVNVCMYVCVCTYGGGAMSDMFGDMAIPTRGCLLFVYTHDGSDCSETYSSSSPSLQKNTDSSTMYPFVFVFVFACLWWLTLASTCIYIHPRICTRTHTTAHTNTHMYIHTYTRTHHRCVEPTMATAALFVSCPLDSTLV